LGVTFGDGKRVRFWETPWLEGRRPMDIAALVYEGSTQKNASSIRLYMGIFGSPNSTLTLASHLITLCNLLIFGKCFKQFIWTPTFEDSTSWNLTNDGCYSS
jgi:hypothetical protein